MIEKIKRNLKIFFLYARLTLKITFYARFGVIFFLLGKILRFLFFLFLIIFVLNRIKLIKDYTLDQIIVFYLIFNLMDTLTQVFFREVYRFRIQVVSGNFNLILTKPHHPFLQILVGGVDFLDLVLLFPYLLLTIYYILKIPDLSIFNLGQFFLLLINGIIIATAFHIGVLAFGILTTETDNTIMIYRDLTNMARFPLDIYQSPVREILTFILPIGIMIMFPAKALFGLLSLKNLCYAFVLGGLFFYLSLRFWRYSLKRYQSWGG